MIITRKKPAQEVLEALKGLKAIAVLGCGRCATTCQTGGEKEVSQMKEFLQSHGFKVTHTAVIEAQCDQRLARLEIKKAEAADAFLSMGCGSGAGALSDLTEKPIIISNDTMFLGVVKRLGDYVERCGMCGQCQLTETMGICVKKRCAKGMLNGPCGGSKGGKCEVDGERDCAWALVIDRMRKAKRLKELGKRRRPAKEKR